jgi:hypothetical protein
MTVAILDRRQRRAPAATGGDPFAACLAAGEVIDHRSERVGAFVARALGSGCHDSRGAAKALYYAVRDGIFYEIFGTDLGEGLCASGVVGARRGFCLHKAILYAAACRAVGIPSRILAAPVRNHVTSPSIRHLVGGDVFLHWYDEILLEGEWIKVAPIFNVMTCRLFGIAPLEFDGRRSATEQPYVGESRMIYLSEPAVFTDPTRAELVDHVARYHPRMVTPARRVPAEREMAALAGALH